MAMKTVEQALVSVEMCGENLRYIPKVLRTAEVCELALADCPEALRYVPNDVVTEEMCFDVVGHLIFRRDVSNCLMK